MSNLWRIEQKEYSSELNRRYETIFTLANGYRGLRGLNEFSRINERGNFIAGVFDKATAPVCELVNCPDPIGIRFLVDNEICDLDCLTINHFKRYLDIKAGTLNTEIEVEIKKKKLEIKTQRFVSRNDVHRWAAEYCIRPINFSGKITIESMIDGGVANGSYDPSNRIRHYQVKKRVDLKPGLAMHAFTIDSNTEIVESSLIACDCGDEQFANSRKYKESGDVTGEVCDLFVTKGESYSIYKYGVTFTSRECEGNVLSSAKENLERFAEDGFECEKKFHQSVWENIWAMSDIEIEGDDKAQRGIRYNIFQMSSSAYEKDPYVSIAAKALHGEGYKGHVFWDTEIYLLTFFTYTHPESARALLLYRYNTLAGARKNAELHHCRGARFPWESASDGVEETPRWGVDSKGNEVRIWTGDEQYHISADIAYAYYEYNRAVADELFLKQYGAEIFLDTALFWQSRVEYNKAEDRYEIKKVIGPDEFHLHVNNNVYTNYLAKWNLRKASEIAAWLENKDIEFYKRLLKKLNIKKEDIVEWPKVAEKIYIPMSKNSKLIEQFEGYFNRKDYVILEYDNNDMPVWPEGVNRDHPDETQLLKQPDVVMLLLVLGEEFDLETKKTNYEYYEKRCMHKSSLSPSMYSIMGLKVGDTRNAYKYFMKTVYTDLEDNQGNTAKGLHAASNGGSWQCAVFGFGGMSIDLNGILNFNPWLPDVWNRLSYKIIWRGYKLHVDVFSDKIVFLSGVDISIKVSFKEYQIKMNEREEVKLTGKNEED